METIPFKIIAVSQNTNSFGLHQIFLTARSGETWKVCKSLCIPEERQRWSEGSVIDVPRSDHPPGLNWSRLSVELPERWQPDITPDLGNVHPDSPVIGDIIRCTDPTQHLSDSKGYRVESLGWSRGYGVPYGRFAARGVAHGGLYEFTVNNFAPFLNQ